jgi:hypothetical protein
MHPSASPIFNVRAIGQCDRSDGDDIVPLPDVVVAIVTATQSHVLPDPEDQRDEFSS